MIVKYTERVGGESVERDGTLVEAIMDWEEVRYPFGESRRRSFLKRVQRALHDGQPVVIAWNVDFNALEDGRFSMKTLNAEGVAGRHRVDI